MKDTRLYAARYLLPIAAPPIEDGALCVRGGRIAAIGRREELHRLAPGAPCTDFGEAILLPPLVNAHTHLELTAFPDWALALGETDRPHSFVDWILRLIRIKRSLPLESFAASLAEGIRQSLKAGTGAVGDILSYLPARTGYRRAPLLGTAFLEVLGRDPDRWQPLLASVDQVLAEADRGRIRFGLSPHSPYTLSEDCLRTTLALARRRGVTVTMHLAESAAETAFLAESRGPLAERFYPAVGWKEMLPPPTGLSPLRYLESCGGFHPGVLLVHGVHVAADDILRIAQQGLSVVLCPRSNARLDAGRAPLADYLQTGVNLAFGTDSRASCDSLSIWDEIAFARSWFGSDLTPQKALEIATVGGARSLGLQGEIGTLAKGTGAHFQVLQPAGSLVREDLYGYLAGGCGADVKHLFLGGEDVLQKSR